MGTYRRHAGAAMQWVRQQQMTSAERSWSVDYIRSMCAGCNTRRPSVADYGISEERATALFNQFHSILCGEAA